MVSLATRCLGGDWGHSPAFTLATYVHLLPDDMPEIDLLDALTDGVTTNEEVEATPVEAVAIAAG